MTVASKKRILLINPPWRFIYGQYKPASKVGVNIPPLGLIYLASFLKSSGYDEVKIIDSEISGYDIQKVIEYSPDAVGITSVTPNFNAAGQIAAEIKQTLKIPIIVGGVHMSVVPDDSMRSCAAIDYGIIGEGEITFTELLSTIDSGMPIKNIDGIAYRNNGDIIKTPPRKQVENIDSFPFPDRTLLEYKKYNFSVPGEGIRPVTNMSTSRGCPFSCTFCASKTLWGRGVRFRSPDNVLDEFEEIVNNLGIKYVFFNDDTFTADKKRVIDICNGILNRNLKFKWEMVTRANIIDEELLSLMKESGLTRMSVGIESGNPEILKKTKKGITLTDIKRAYRIASKLGVETRGSIMIGLPYETKKTAMETLRFARNLKECKQMYINIATPFPGTEFFDMAKRGEGGIKLLTQNPVHYTRYANSVIDVNDLKKKDLIFLQKLGYWMFYMTPARIKYNILRAGIPAGIRNVIAFLRSLLK
ncbi:MAG: radical SAM protein [Elusimicrobiota bacterium]